MQLATDVHFNNGIQLTNDMIYKLLIDINEKVDKLNKKFNNTIFKKRDYKISIRHCDNYFEYLNEKTIRKLLETRGPSAEFKFFKLLFPKQNDLPFRIVGNKMFCYYDGESWNDDTVSESLIKIFLGNVKKVYMKLNTCNYYSSNPQKFIDNQKHIFKLMNDSKTKKLLSLIYKEYKECNGNKE
tara:strand:+ start:4079 stop:4630 length:552 start_codon:yes stop_codon:yes gene_type:complete